MSFQTYLASVYTKLTSEERTETSALEVPPTWEEVKVGPKGPSQTQWPWEIRTGSTEKIHAHHLVIGNLK